MFESLECIARDVAVAADADPYVVDRGELNDALIQLREMIRRLEALELTLTRAHDHRQAWKDDGANSAKQWHRDRRHLTAGEAARHVDTARELTRLPQTAEKVAAGEISVDQACVATRVATRMCDDEVARLDTLMVESAPVTNVSETRKALARFSHSVDPGSLEARERRAHERRSVRMGVCADGGVWIEGRLDTITGEAALTVTSAMSAPTGEDDDRTGDQRLADAVGDVFMRALKWDADIPAEGGRVPTISATVDWSTLVDADGAPAAELEHQGPVSGETARQLACDANIHRVITRGRCEIVDLGRTQRVVSVAQRRALIARDRGCVGCGAPPAWTDAHHIIFWADGGDTDLDNLVLLCRSCHTGVHHRRWRVDRRADGSLEVQRPPRSLACVR